MAIDDRLQAQLTEITRQRLLQREEAAALQGGDGGGTSGGMEERVAKLEAHMEHANKQLDRLVTIPAELARLQERVAHLPSKGFIVSASVTTIALLTAAITFADKLRALIGG